MNVVERFNNYQKLVDYYQYLVSVEPFNKRSRVLLNRSTRAHEFVEPFNKHSQPRSKFVEPFNKLQNYFC